MSETLTLRNGALRFSALAAGEGETVLLLHGFPDTPETFAAQLPALAEAGYRAVAPMMRGYESSSQPADGDYHAVRMAEDVVAWLDDLGVARAHLVGHDWGASIAYATAALAPERLASLTTLAVAHPVRFGEAYLADPAQQMRSAYILSFLSPDAEAMIAVNRFAYLAQLWRDWSPGWDVPEAALAAMRARFAQPGVAEAALAYYRQGIDATSPAGVATQALYATPIAVPTLGLCGEDDGCVAADVFAGAMRTEDFPTELAVKRIVGAGHFLHRERPAAVNGPLIDWLRRHPAG
jgi:pimeloyl-ACP methyl ester carboxylesterase